VTYTGALHGIDTYLGHGEVRPIDTRKIHEILGPDAYKHKQKYYSVLDYLLKMPDDTPFFLLVWFLDPHAPYRPPREVVGDMDAEGRDLPNGVGFYRDLTAIEIKDIAGEFSGPEVRLLRDLYVGEVESVDGRIGNIIRALRHTGRLTDTYVIFTSDHGEAFGEHGRFCHGGTEFYTEMTHVPLIVGGRDLARGARISTPVSHVQLIPTIRVLLDLGSDHEPSARSYIDPSVTLRREATPVYFAGASDTCYAVLDGDWKMVKNGRDLRLFNLADDPGELTSVYERFPEPVVRLSEWGARITAENVKHRQATKVSYEAQSRREEETLEIKKTLRSLGYVR
jgi:arylsulfatase A-like enzyme